MFLFRIETEVIEVPKFLELIGPAECPCGFYVTEDGVQRAAYLDGTYELDTSVIYKGVRGYRKISDVHIMADDLPKKSLVQVYRSFVNPSEELITLDGIMMMIRVDTMDDIDHMKFGMKHPTKYLVNDLIKKGFVKTERKRQHKRDIIPTNVVVSLESIDQIKDEDLFVTTKVDGVTCVLAYDDRMSILVAFELKGKGLTAESKLLYLIEDVDLMQDSSVWLGEYLPDPTVEGKGRTFIFMKSDDTIGDYRVEYKMMEDFVRRVNRPEITLNKIVIATPPYGPKGEGENYRGVTKRIIDLDDGSIPTDGYVYGIIKNKIQYKWKPAHKKTIDFYMKYYVVNRRYARLHLYLADNVNKAFKRLKDARGSGPRVNYMKIIKKPRARYVLQIYAVETTIESGDPDVSTFDAIIEKYNDKIGECQYIDGVWRPTRLRPDKTWPNNYAVGESIFQTIKNPIKLSDLV